MRMPPQPSSLREKAGAVFFFFFFFFIQRQLQSGMTQRRVEKIGEVRRDRIAQPSIDAGWERIEGDLPEFQTPLSRARIKWKLRRVSSNLANLFR